MTTPGFDPVMLAVLASSFEGVVREMSDTLLRTGRSSVINMARDFSCSLLTADNRVLALAEGIPIHVAGSGLLGEAMARFHSDIRPGDAFLHNDPYSGNSHAADHSILVPVFIEGEHMFTAVMKAHQADIGNASPTTYAPEAPDVYAEGALIFPCVRIQRDGKDVEDIIRMCQRRIRVPEQWYGDYLGMIGGARIAEQRIHRIAERYGKQTLKDFPEAWFDYSERRITQALRRMPKLDLHASCTHDPFTGTEADGLKLNARVQVDPENARVEVDLRDNPDNLPNGLNLTEATSLAAALTGVLGSLDEEVPVNAGTFRRIAVHLREGCVAGIPRFPASCSVATTNVADRIIAMIQRAFAMAQDGYGAGEGGLGHPPAKGVVSGIDSRNGRRYVNQLLLAAQGGPATAYADGWPTYHRPVADALLYHDSVEIDEQRYPILVRERTLVQRSGGHGRHCGGLASRVSLEARFSDVTIAYAIEAATNPPRGAAGGSDACPSSVRIFNPDGTEAPAPLRGTVRLARGQVIVSTSTGGGGYGDPRTRDPALVDRDLKAGYITTEDAQDIYACVVRNGAVEFGETVEYREGLTANAA
jgi:N-methylhydantoinase B